MIPDAPKSNLTDWTVSELSGALKRTLEDAFGFVRVRGEIFGYRGQHNAGHAYFCLKDQDAKIEAVIWGRTFARLRVKPKEGLEVVATGRVTTFPNKSTYQIVVDSLEPAGIGAWMALLEERRKALAAEGLFAEARKRRLPYIPGVIGVVTSPTGAVIRDILHRLADRFPRPVLVWPVRVQGEACAEEVAAAIAGFNALEPDGDIPRPDVIVVARGGGSIEDLWGFNEEIVVRAAAESAIPLVSAIGHETDATLLDLVADRRAPTPTGAAEMIVPVRSDLLAGLDKIAFRQHGAVRRQVDGRGRDLRSAARALPRPDGLLAGPRQRLDGAGRDLAQALKDGRHARGARLAAMAGRLAPFSPAARLAGLRATLAGLAGRDGLRPSQAIARLVAERRRGLGRAEARLDAARCASLARLRRDRERLDAAGLRRRDAWTRHVERKGERLAGLAQLFGSLNYRAVLARGYALVRDEAGRLVRGPACVKEGERLAIELADGRVSAVAEDPSGRSARGRARVDEAPPRPLPKSRTKAGRSAQGSQGLLFDA